MPHGSDGWNRLGNRPQQGESSNPDATQEAIRELKSRLGKVEESCLTWADFDRWDNERKESINLRFQAQEKSFAEAIRQIHKTYEWVNAARWKVLGSLAGGTCFLLWWIYLNHPKG